MIYFICDTITGKATASGPTPERIEKAFHAKWAGRRGPEQVICAFNKALGVKLENFHLFPKSMIWAGVALYARQKAGLAA